MLKETIKKNTEATGVNQRGNNMIFWYIYLAIIACLIITPIVIWLREGLRFRISRDTWDSVGGKFIKYDKIEHFIGGFFSYVLLRAVGFLFGTAFLCASAFWIIWEIKDGFVYWERYGYWGGDGASWKDAFCSVLGVGSGVLAEQVFILVIIKALGI